MLVNDKRAPINKTFCILAWRHLEITPTGTAKLCCIANQPISKDGKAMSLYEYTVDEIWNSDYMRNARQAMLNGEPVADCAACYHAEALHGSSMRTRQNPEWLQEPEREIQEIHTQALSNDYRVEELPVYYQFGLGNLCNLSCRMCCSDYSDKIAQDEIQSRWVPHNHELGPILTQWENDSLVIGPRPIAGVRYNGFHPFHMYSHRDLAWTTGDATVKTYVQEASKLVKLQIQLADFVKSGTWLKVSLNDQVAFDGHVKTAPWVCEIDLSSLTLEPSLEISIRSDIFRLPDYPKLSFGLPIEDIRLVRTKLDPSAKRTASKFASSRFSKDAPWYNQHSLFVGEFLRDAHKVRKLYFSGGEPTLNRRLEGMLDFLIDVGASEQIFLMFNSNGTIFNQRLMEKLSKFKCTIFGLSVDAFGEEYGYIRYPSSWETVEATIEKLRQVKHISLWIIPAIQALNVMNIVKLSHFCDERDLRCDIRNMVLGLRHMSMFILPGNARRVAAERLRNYSTSPASTENQKANREDAAEVLHYLESTPVQTEFLREFMLFTNDLDRKRNQDFKKVHRELYELILDSGFKWTDETKFFCG